MAFQRHMNGAAFADWSGMLNGVGDQFVHDQRERGRHLSGDSERVGVDDKRPRSIGTARCGCDRLTKIDEVTINLHRSDIVIFVKLLVDDGDGLDARRCVVKLICCGARCFGLQMQETGHNLQVVLDAVIELFQQQVFLPSAFLKLTFCLLKLLAFVQIPQ